MMEKTTQQRERENVKTCGQVSPYPWHAVATFPKASAER